MITQKEEMIAEKYELIAKCSFTIILYTKKYIADQFWFTLDQIIIFVRSFWFQTYQFKFWHLR